MKETKGFKHHKVIDVIAGSIAEELEIEPGDTLFAINGEHIQDVFDYRYLMSDEVIEVSVKKLSGEIKADGSSTVGPITQVAVEEFSAIQPNVKIPVGISGTGGGLKKFAAGEIDIANASRKIKDAEAAACKEKGIEYVEFQVAYDGITVVVNKENNWVTDIKVEELKKIWEPDSKVQTWKDVNPAWPKKK